MMPVKSAAREGLEFGLCAGLIFAVADIVAAAVQLRPVFYPLYAVAGDLLGPEAVAGLSSGTMLLAGIALHLAMGAVFGVLYGLVNAPFSGRTHMRWDWQTAIGLLFGAAVWAVKWQLLARYVHPAFLEDKQLQLRQLALHIFCFGWPMALFYATAERRLDPLRRAMQEG